MNTSTTNWFFFLLLLLFIHSEWVVDEKNEFWKKCDWIRKLLFWLLNFWQKFGLVFKSQTLSFCVQFSFWLNHFLRQLPTTRSFISLILLNCLYCHQFEFVLSKWTTTNKNKYCLFISFSSLNFCYVYFYVPYPDCHFWRIFITVCFVPLSFLFSKEKQNHCIW
jgi:hypothetical protein